jgi:hypothetical protein
MLALDKPQLSPRLIYETIQIELDKEYEGKTFRLPTMDKVTKALQNLNTRLGNNNFHSSATGELSKLSKTDDRLFLQMTQTYQVRVIKNPGPVLHSLYVWAHPNLIKYLKYGLKTYIDGTFKCVPGGFKQLLILMVFEPNSKEYVPVIYGLAMDKTESTYKQFFKMIDYICEGEWNPSEVTTDFEKGLRNAVCGIY